MAVLVCLCSAVALAQGAFIRLPKLSEGAIELRVASVRSSRLPRMSASHLKWVLDSARTGVYEHFGVTVGFTQPKIMDIREAFQRFARGHREELCTQI